MDPPADESATNPCMSNRKISLSSVDGRNGWCRHTSALPGPRVVRRPSACLFHQGLRQCGVLWCMRLWFRCSHTTRSIIINDEYSLKTRSSGRLSRRRWQRSSKCYCLTRVSSKLWSRSCHTTRSIIINDEYWLKTRSSCRLSRRRWQRSSKCYCLTRVSSKLWSRSCHKT